MLSGSIERSVRYVKDRQDRWLYQKRETDVAFVANKGYMHGFIFTDNRIVHGAESGRFKREWPEGGTISSLVLFIESWTGILHQDFGKASVVLKHPRHNPAVA